MVVAMVSIDEFDCPNVILNWLRLNEPTNATADGGAVTVKAMVPLNPRLSAATLELVERPAMNGAGEAGLASTRKSALTTSCSVSV